MEAQAGFCLRAERKVVSLHPDVRRGLSGLPVLGVREVARGEIRQGWRFTTLNIFFISDLICMILPGRWETPRLFNLETATFR